MPSLAQSAPFGLTWGMTSEAVRALGASIQAVDTKENGASFVAKDLPMALSDQEATALFFGHDDRLWRVVALGRAVSNDPYGTSAKSRYDELSEALVDKYGKGAPFHRLGSSIYAQPNNFVSGLKMGETHWHTSFAAKEVSVIMDLYAPDMSSVRWRISFENKELKRLFELSKKSREKKAL